jgi:hypothetical protein
LLPVKFKKSTRKKGKQKNQQASSIGNDVLGKISIFVESKFAAWSIGKKEHAKYFSLVLIYVITISGHLLAKDKKLIVVKRQGYPLAFCPYFKLHKVNGAKHLGWS